jgi:hypothetical protein
MDTARPRLWVPALVVLLLLVIGYEVLVWRECLVDRPWWYCLRLLGTSS